MKLTMAAASVVLAGLALAAVFLAPHPQQADTLRAQPKPVAEEIKARPRVPLPKMSLAPAEPTRLRVPSLNIDAEVEKVGLTDNEMTEPTNGEVISWYRYGYLPGAIGNAVFAGHLIYQKQPAVFHDLAQLKMGQIIEVDTKRSTIFFAVRAKKQYDDATSHAEVFKKGKKAQLQLVTCDGVWDAGRQRFTQRLVVTAEFVREIDK